MLLEISSAEFHLHVEGLTAGEFRGVIDRLGVNGLVGLEVRHRSYKFPAPHPSFNKDTIKALRLSHFRWRSLGIL